MAAEKARVSMKPHLIEVAGSTFRSEKSEVTLDAKQNVTLNTATEENKKDVEEWRSSKRVLSAGR